MYIILSYTKYNYFIINNYFRFSVSEKHTKCNIYNTYNSGMALTYEQL